MAVIEYFYAAYSGYAYLGSSRFLEITAKYGRSVEHKPYDLRVGMLGIGSKPPSERTAGHLEYFFGRELERWSEFRNAPVMHHPPTHHHKSIIESNTFLIAGIVLGFNIDQLAHSMMEQHWRFDADLSNLETLENIADMVGIDPALLMKASVSREVLDIYEANTKEAIARSIFGSPTYIIDGDMFYGQDRLEMVERALKKPFTKQIPKNY